MTLNPANMPIWDPYTIILGNWAWALGRRCAVRVGAHMGYPVYAPMAVMHAASGLGELGLGEMPWRTPTSQLNIEVIIT